LLIRTAIELVAGIKRPPPQFWREKAADFIAGIWSDVFGGEPPSRCVQDSSNQHKVLLETETFSAPDGDDFHEGAEGKEQLL
jgi:hypothetical protein